MKALTTKISNELKNYALQIGASNLAVGKLHSPELKKIIQEQAKYNESWIENGYAGEMKYMIKIFLRS